jgi:hypothetical protein
MQGRSRGVDDYNLKKITGKLLPLILCDIVLHIETALAKNLLMQARVMADSEPVSSRAQAVGLLQELNHPVCIYLKYK